MSTTSQKIEVEVKPYPVPASEARVEMRVSNSRFIATAGPAFTIDEAKAFITRIRQEFPDATHNVPVYLIGHGATIVAHAGDDGEPAGTAGRPALAVLRGSGLGDVVVVITRYFGGTKLGTGGLVRAYGDAVRQVLAVMPRALRTATYTARIVIPYATFERVRLLITSHHGRVLGEEFAADVTLTARFATDDFPAFQASLQELSGGRIEAQVIETNDAAIIPG